MENALKKRKWIWRVIAGASLAIIALLCFSLTVFAVPSTVTDFRAATVGDTSISLVWTMATSSNSTVIRYSTISYPATYSSGTSGYNGTASSTTISGLNAGTTYYFSAWGYDGSSYSTSPAQLVVSTTSSISENTTLPFTPTMPTGVWQNATTSGWSWQPFDAIVAWFSDNTSSHGGLGMQSSDLMLYLMGLFVTGIGILSYIKWHTFFASWFIILILCGFFSAIHVMQWLVVIIIILVGMGVWAVEHNFQ